MIQVTDAQGTIAPRQGSLGAVIWLTGLSGAGKSTLATGLARDLLRRDVVAMVLDGDVLRAGLCRDLGFSPAERKENIRRAAETALLLAKAGVVVITALISPFRAERKCAARQCHANGLPFAEVFVNAPLAECERRDPKRLYHRARAGQIPDFTGISSPYEAPLAPALELRTDRESIQVSRRKLLALVEKLRVQDGTRAKRIIARKRGGMRPEWHSQAASLR